MTKKLIRWMTAVAFLPGVAGAEWVNGEIVAIDAAKKRVILQHEAIHVADMEAMTMPFKVDDAAILAPYHVGDRIRADVYVRNDELLITKLERRE